MAKRTLRGIRNDLGLTQNEMAKKLSVPLVSYQRYEQMKSKIPASVLLELANMVNIVDIREIKFI